MSFDRVAADVGPDFLGADGNEWGARHDAEGVAGLVQDEVQGPEAAPDGLQGKVGVHVESGKSDKTGEVRN